MIYPFPDGVQPSDLAARTNMTKQAMNHLLGKLETLGYVKRRAMKRRSSTLVFLTRRGRRALDTVCGAAMQAEEEWVAMLGRKRFGVLVSMLWQLAGLMLAPNPPSDGGVGRLILPKVRCVLL